MDVMELIDNLDNFIIINNNILKYNGDGYTNYAIYGSCKELSPIVKDYFNEKNINVVSINIDKEEGLETDLVELARSLVEKKAVLLLEYFGDVEYDKRKRFETIYKDLSVNGAKINYLGTIVFMDRDSYKLDFDEEEVFKRIK